MECGYNNYGGTNFPYAGAGVYPNFTAPAMAPYYAHHAALVPPPTALSGAVPGAGLRPGFSSMNQAAAAAAAAAAALSRGLAVPPAQQQQQQQQPAAALGPAPAPQQPATEPSGTPGRAPRARKESVASSGSGPRGASECSEPSPEEQPVVNDGAGSLPSVGLRSSLLEETINRRKMALFRSEAVVAHLRDYQHRIYVQRRDRVMQEMQQQQQQAQQAQQQQRAIAPPAGVALGPPPPQAVSMPQQHPPVSVAGGYLPPPVTAQHLLGDGFGY